MFFNLRHFLQTCSCIPKFSFSRIELRDVTKIRLEQLIIFDVNNGSFIEGNYLTVSGG